MVEYRRKKESEMWHWCPDCSNWPTSNYIVSDSVPTNGDFDKECNLKEFAEHARIELEKELKKYKCEIHNRSPKIRSSNSESATIDCCCLEFEVEMKRIFCN